MPFLAHTILIQFFYVGLFFSDVAFKLFYQQTLHEGFIRIHHISPRSESCCTVTKRHCTTPKQYPLSSIDTSLKFLMHWSDRILSMQIARHNTNLSSRSKIGEKRFLINNREKAKMPENYPPSPPPCMKSGCRLQFFFSFDWSVSHFKISLKKQFTLIDRGGEHESSIRVL